MFRKIAILMAGLLALVFVCGGAGGCGETVFSSSSYYYPNWMPDGRIICSKVTSTWSSAIWGRKELGDTYYITAITINNSNEITSEENLFEISDTAKEITCSPTGELIAYIASYPYDKITVSNYLGTSTSVLSGIENVEYLDWSPDATKLVYSNSDRELHVVNRDGTGDTQIATSAEAVAWRVGEKLVFEDSVYNKLWVSNSDGSSKEVVVSSLSSKPQVSTTETIVFRGSDNQVKSISIVGTGEALLFSGYERTTLKLSFDNTKIVGGDLITGGGSRIGGIWVTNISNGSSTQIK